MSGTIQITEKERQFYNAYLEAIDFTDTGDIGQPPHGTELDVFYMREALIDCLSFYQRIACYISDDRIEEAAHDFWFTRNGHGAGFWDGDWDDVLGNYGEKFTKIAEGYGETDVYFEDVPLIEEG